MLQEIFYEHPIFDMAAIQAQTQVPHLQGQQHTWFAGAWMGYGFHEDGLQAAHKVVQHWLHYHQTTVTEALW